MVRILLPALLALLLSCNKRESDVSVRDTFVTIRTNLEALQNDAPQFSALPGRGVYPYPVRKNLDYTLREVKARALVLENRYLTVTVLPEFGGHVLSAVDKLTGRNMFWDNPELKQALIGLSGAWAAFGLEFNFPKRGHINTSMTPVNSALQALEDGGAAVVVGDREYYGGQFWTAKLILRPASPRLEIQVSLYNPTELPKPIYYWCNAAVKADSNLQVIFPQPQSTTHNSPWIRPWPVEEDGADLSWYKNHKGYMYSRFNRGDAENFMGYYDHGRKFGAFHWADRSELPYRKFWSWGLTPVGKNWNKRLSETGGEYVELQAGLFKDQETHAFLPPHRTISLTEYWIPARNMGGLQYANLDAALSLSVDSVSGSGVKVRYGANTYRPFGKGRLLLFRDGEIVADQRVRLKPEAFHDFIFEGPGHEGRFAIKLLAESGDTVLSFAQDGYRADRLEKIGPIRYPKERRTVDAETHLARARYEELRYRLPQAMEALRKGLGAFPHSPQLCLAAARLSLLRGEPDSALALLDKVALIPDDDSEIDYLRGLAWLARDDTARADHFLGRASRTGPNPGACAFLRGRIRAARGDWEAALPFFEAASADGTDLFARFALGCAKMRIGRKDQAVFELEELIRVNPIYYPAYGMLPPGHKISGTPASLPRRELKQWLYLASDLSDLGLDAAAKRILTQAESFNRDPMNRYALGFIESRLGNKSAGCLEKAAACDVTGSWPHTLFEQRALDFALSQKSEDPAALHLAGTLLLSQGRTGEGTALLEKAVTLEGHSLYTRYILSLAYQAQEAPLQRRIDQLEAALAAQPGMQYAALQLVDLYARSGRPAQERLALLQKTRAVAGENAVEELDATLVLAFMDAGRFAEAAEQCKVREFHTWEGGAGIRPLWWNIHLIRAALYLRQGLRAKALEMAGRSMDFPPNISASESDYGLEGWRTPFLRALIFRKNRQAADAREAFMNSAGWNPQQAGNSSRPRIIYERLFAVPALKALGRNGEAGTILSQYREALEGRGEQSEEDRDEVSPLTVVLYHHLAGQRKKAMEEARNLLKTQGFDLERVLLKAYLDGLLGLE